MPQYAVRFSHPTNPDIDLDLTAALADLAPFDVLFGESDAGGRHGDVHLIAADSSDDVERIAAEVAARVPGVTYTWVEADRRI